MLDSHSQKKLVSVDKGKNGFVALIFVMVMSIILLIYTVSSSLRSIESLQTNLWSIQSDESYQAAYACVQDGFFRLRRNWRNYQYSFTVQESLCTIDIVTTPASAELNSRGLKGDFSRTIAVGINNQFNILWWAE